MHLVPFPLIAILRSNAVHACTCLRTLIIHLEHCLSLSCCSCPGEPPRHSKKVSLHQPIISELPFRLTMSSVTQMCVQISSPDHSPLGVFQQFQTSLTSLVHKGFDVLLVSLIPTS